MRWPHPVADNNVGWPSLNQVWPTWSPWGHWLPYTSTVVRLWTGSQCAWVQLLMLQPRWEDNHMDSKHSWTAFRWSGVRGLILSSHKLKQQWFRSHVGRNFFSMKTVKNWRGCPKRWCSLHFCLISSGGWTSDLLRSLWFCDPYNIAELVRWHWLPLPVFREYFSLKYQLFSRLKTSAVPCVGSPPDSSPSPCPSMHSLTAQDLSCSVWWLQCCDGSCIQGGHWGWGEHTESFRKIHATVFNRKHFPFWVNVEELLP